ncbi:MAG: putative 26S proteasome regulatory subunit [Watsoniomyces obsoletus]|nr:MAG: putative 26S proteasome regulatory subunit [Watsoniomyces obsoletus]
MSGAENMAGPGNGSRRVFGTTPTPAGGPPSTRNPYTILFQQRQEISAPNEVNPTPQVLAPSTIAPHTIPFQQGQQISGSNNGVNPTPNFLAPPNSVWMPPPIAPRVAGPSSVANPFALGTQPGSGIGHVDTPAVQYRPPYHGSWQSPAYGYGPLPGQPTSSLVPPPPYHMGTTMTADPMSNRFRTPSVVRNLGSLDLARDGSPSQMRPLTVVPPGSDDMPHGGIGPSRVGGAAPPPGGPTAAPITDVRQNHPSGARKDAKHKNTKHVTDDARKTTEEIRTLLGNIRPDMELPPENRQGTPEQMKKPLLEHQKLGLSWLHAMEEGSNKGGILADDMGLGKTIQTIALILSRPSTDPECKTTLIVAPLTLLQQWAVEIKEKVKEPHALTTIIFDHSYHGVATWEHLKKFDVVLTTYGKLASEFAAQEERGKKMPRKGSEKGVEPRKLPMLGPSSKWYRVVLDEAQCIRNPKTNTAKAACELKAVTRFCLTGTPMMNHVGELQSLLAFLHIPPYDDAERFNAEFTIPSRQKWELPPESAMIKLQALLKAVLLRRTKHSTMDDGQPILPNLPPRFDEIAYAVFDQDQRAFYTALETKTQVQFNRFLRQGAVGQKQLNPLSLLLRLRQACCHPHLINDLVPEERIPTGLSDPSMVVLAHQLPMDVVERIRSRRGVFKCPVCWEDAVTNPAILVPCGHDICSDCLKEMQDQARNPESTEGSEGATDVKCPQCRRTITAEKVLDYRTFERVRLLPDDDDEHDEEEDDKGNLGPGYEEYPEEELEELEEEGDDDMVIKRENELDHEDDDDGRGVGVGRGLLGGAAGHGNKKRKRGEETWESSKKAVNQDGFWMPTAPVRPSDNGNGKGKQRATEDDETRQLPLVELKKLALKNTHYREIYFSRLRNDWITSAKIEKCEEIIESILQRTSDEKILVFSQWTSFLDLIEVGMNRKRWGFTRIDGTMKANLRHEAVTEFQNPENARCRIMLLSLKAGNVGLNLTVASYVILMDPYWHPYDEEQAVNRTHRIGQKRPVNVYRILVQKTVEDRIVKLQNQKRELIDGALSEEAAKNVGKLPLNELAFFFGVAEQVNRPLGVNNPS